MGSLSNDDGDGNENGKKVNGLYKQNNNFARASRSFVHFLAVVASLRLETDFLISRARFMELVSTAQEFSFSFSNSYNALSDSPPDNFVKILQIK